MWRLLLGGDSLVRLRCSEGDLRDLDRLDLDRLELVFCELVVFELGCLDTDRLDLARSCVFESTPGAASLFKGFSDRLESCARLASSVLCLVSSDSLCA